MKYKLPWLRANSSKVDPKLGLSVSTLHAYTKLLSEWMTNVRVACRTRHSDRHCFSKQPGRGTKGTSLR